MNHEAVCRWAPATPGLIKIAAQSCPRACVEKQWARSCVRYVLNPDFGFWHTIPYREYYKGVVWKILPLYKICLYKKHRLCPTGLFSSQPPAIPKKILQYIFEIHAILPWLFMFSTRSFSARMFAVTSTGKAIRIFDMFSEK